MNTDPQRSSEPAELRLRAEEKLQTQISSPDSEVSEAQRRRLFHELQVHQVELEMQNEELRDSQTRLEAALARSIDLYDFAPVGYFTLTSDGTIQEVNLPGARLLGLERGLVTGRSFRSFVFERTQSIFDGWLNDVFAPQIKQSCHVELKREGSPPVPVEIEATLSFDRFEARAIVSDITLRKSLEEELRQSQKMEIVGQLAGGVAHDFNNILGAMLLNLEMTQLQHQLPPEAKSSLHDLETLARRAASLTHQLLQFSRRQAMIPVKMEINGAVTRLLKMLERLLGENIDCHRLQGTQELWIDADEGMLDQAVMNLCVNARDAMPQGGTITFESSLVEFTAEQARSDPESRPGKFACLQIGDTGCGMDAQVLKHLFEPFYTTKEIGKGTGLGLASAYGVMQQHKGWISVDSVVGKGTRFRLYFPLSKETQVSSKVNRDRPLLKGQNKTILLVEDETSLLSVSTQALSMLGYHVLPATNGPEALQLWEKHQDTIDLLLTDMRMPRGMNGLELARKLWETNPSLRTIIMSGYTMDLPSESNRNETGYTLLAKPFDVRSLADIVHKCLVEVSTPSENSVGL